MGNKLSYPEADISGEVAIVTGGNCGIGYETAKGLARLGAHTFIACRSKERAEEAIDRMKAELNPDSSKQKEERAEEKDEGGSGGKETVGEGQTVEESGDGEGRSSEPNAAGEGKEGSEQESIVVEYLPLDLSSFQSTIDCVRAFKEKNLPLHILINNAALAWTPFELTADGFENQFQVNVLGPMLLTLELLPLLLSTAATSGDGRIVFVSSRASFQAPPFNADKIVVTEEADYNRLRTYPTTKLYDTMLSFALQRRLQDSSITVSSLQPGYVKTGLARGWQDKTFVSFLNKIGYAAVARSPVEGAMTSLNCAVNPDFKTQECHFYSNCKVAPPPAQARIENSQELLWQKVIEILKDHLSSEILEKYGKAYVKQEPPPTTEAPQETPPTTEAPQETPPSTEAPPPTIETLQEPPPTTEAPQGTPPTAKAPQETPPTTEVPPSKGEPDETPVESEPKSAATPTPEESPAEPTPE